MADMGVAVKVGDAEAAAHHAYAELHKQAALEMTAAKQQLAA